MHRSIQALMLMYWIFGTVTAEDIDATKGPAFERSKFTKTNPLVFAEHDMEMTASTALLFRSAARQVVKCHTEGIRKHIVCNPDTIRVGGFTHAIRYKLHGGTCYEGVDISKINVLECMLVVKSSWVPDFLSGLILTAGLMGLMSCFSCGSTRYIIMESIQAAGVLLWILVGSAMLGAADGATDNDSYVE